MNEDHPELDEHISDGLIGAYVAGDCNPEEEYEVEKHCLSCRECCTRVAVLLHLSGEAKNATGQPGQGKGDSAGKEAIKQLLHKVNGLEFHGAPKSAQSDLNKSRLWPLSSFSMILSNRRFQLCFGGGALVLVLMGAIYYWYQHSPGTRIQDWKMTGRRNYGYSRPLQARITGGFPYQPYERKRGSLDGKESDEDQLVKDQFGEALVALTRAVAAKPTVESRHELGRLYLLMHDFDNADAQLTKALENAPRNARLHNDLGALYYERSYGGDPFKWLSKAIDQLNQAIEIEPQLTEVWFNRALCHYQMTLFSKTKSDWERYLEVDPKSQWADEARKGLEKLQAWQGRSADQNKSVHREFREAAAANDRKTMRRLVTERFAAVSQLATGELLDEYLEASLAGKSAAASALLKTLTLTGQLVNEVKSDRYIADVVDFAGKASLAVKREVRNVRLLLQRASHGMNAGDYDDAFKHYSEALQISERIGDKFHAEIADIKIASFYNVRANFYGLEAASGRLVANTEGRHHRQLHAKALTALATAYMSGLQFSRALDLSLEAAKIAKDIDDPETAILGQLFAGNVYMAMGDYERGLQKNFEAIGILRDSPFSQFETARVHGIMGEALLMAGSYQRALDYNHEVLQVAKHIGNPVHLAGLAGRLGFNYWKLGRLEEADAQFKDAVERTKAINGRTARLFLQAEIYTPFGDFCLRQNKPDEAIAKYQEALNIFGKTNYRVYLFAIHQGLAAAYQAQGKIEEAESELRASIRLAERDRQQINDARGRSVYLLSRQDVYRAMMEFQFFTKHDPAQAFNYAEISKSRDLLDILTGKIKAAESDGSKTLKVSGNAHPLTLKQVQQALPANAQLLEYSIGQDRLVIWLVNREEVFPVSVGIGTDDLRQSIKDYLDGIRGRRDVEIINRKAAELYKTLIAPIAARLDRNRVLCIIPDGMLSQLPFASLVSHETGRYLVEDYSLAVNPSASVMAQALAISNSKKARSPESFLGIGNPRFNHQRFPDLPPLPSAEQEVTRVKSNYPQAQILSRENATESALVSSIGQYDIAHLATHVIINEQFPLLSSIVLAEENRQPAGGRGPRNTIFDGSLLAYEIYQLNLPRTRLVLLSGCRSALGSYTRGEALSGLAQAFLAAGVPTVIASLWDIDDDSTSELMREFHHQYRVKRQNYSESLRQAQYSLIRGTDTRRRHPYYWAAFLLAGNGCDSPLTN